jgi:hypothetical protein
VHAGGGVRSERERRERGEDGRCAGRQTSTALLGADTTTAGETKAVRRTTFHMGPPLSGR